MCVAAQNVLGRHSTLGSHKYAMSCAHSQKQPHNQTTRQHTSSPPLPDHDISEFPHKVPHVKPISTSSVFWPWRSEPHKTHRLSLYRSTVSSEPYASRRRLDDLTTQHTGKPQVIPPGTTSRYHRVKTFFFSVGATRRRMACHFHMRIGSARHHHGRAPAFQHARIMYALNDGPALP